MAKKKVTRRLAAILAADVVGYSRLVGLDEEGTIARLKALRDETIDPSISKHDGRIVKTTGDGVLVEFSSVVDAVRSAVEVQEAVAEHEASISEDRRIALRVGVNLGDIVIDGDDILGDGVNVAARLEGLAELGGICLSDDAYRQVRDKLDLAFVDAGEHELKNIARSINVWRWTGAGAAMPAEAEPPVLELPDRPSIAVLPFENMSGDPDQEYFSDGITEEIITRLSRIRWLFVIARHTSFTYKNEAVNVKQVAGALGVAYVVEGSVRKAANRVRITAQVADGTSGTQIWAERYDRDLDDIFAVQDEIAETIVAAIEPELGDIERERARRKPPQSLDAWDLYQRGLWHMYNFTNEGLDEALALFARAIAMDADFAPSYAGSAYVHVQKAFYAAPETRAKALDEALRMARIAVSHDDKDAGAHFTLGRAHTLRREFEPAVAELETAIELNPSFAQAHFGLAFALTHSDQMEKALHSLDTAIRLSPHDPHLWSFYTVRGLTNFYLGQYGDAATWASRGIRHRNATFWPHLVYTAALAYLGHLDNARAALAELLKRKPGYTCAIARDDFFFARNDELVERAVDGLRKAGLPE